MDDKVECGGICVHSRLVLQAIDELAKHRIKFLYKILQLHRHVNHVEMRKCQIPKSHHGLSHFDLECFQLACGVVFTLLHLYMKVTRKCGIELAHKQVFVDSIHRSRGKNNE